MTSLRPLSGSEPDIQVAEEDGSANASTTVHFDARPVRAATQVAQEAQSIVVREAVRVPGPLDPADVTLTVRPRAGSRAASRRVVAWLETRWVVLIAALAVLLMLLFGIELLR